MQCETVDLDLPLKTVAVRSYCTNTSRISLLNSRSVDVKPRVKHFRAESLMGARHPTVVLGVLAAVISRIAAYVVNELGPCKDLPLETILLTWSCGIELLPTHNVLGNTTSFLEQVLISSNSSTSKRLKVCREMVRLFVGDLETSLRRGDKPFSDKKVVSLLPFSSEMKDYLPNMHFLVLQITFPADVMNKRVLLLLLMSRIFCISVEQLLDELQCEDQALVVQETSCYLVTDNHALEGLVLLSSEQSCLYLIVGYNAEKCSPQMMDGLCCSIMGSFNREFPSKCYTIKKLDTCADPLQPPQNEQNGSNCSVEADNSVGMIATGGAHAQESDSGQTNYPSKIV